MSLTAPFTAWTSGSVPSAPVSLARIVVGFSVLLQYFEIGPLLDRMGRDGVFLLPWSPDMSAPAAPVLGWIRLGWLLGGTAFTAGLATPVSGLVLASSQLALLLADQQAYSNHLYLGLLAVGLLTVARAGGRYSLDALMFGGRLRSPGWAVLQLRVLVSVIYGFGALAKLNASFLYGDVLARTTDFESLAGIVGRRVAWMAVIVGTVGTVAAEGALAVWPWFASRRRIAFLLAVALHTGMVLLMQDWLRLQLVVFALLMVGLLVTFHAEPEPESLGVRTTSHSQLQNR